MRKSAFAYGLAIFMAFSGTALADRPGPDWMKEADVKKQMEKQGYSSITMEADDGHWDGEAVKDDKIVEFHADAHTGQITKSEPKRAG
jgi:hypothetical protein